jgi:nucleoside-diphosphate-sugar epimerase
MEREVVVTGAGGFIGRHLVAELAARGQRVRALVRTAGRRPAAHPSVEVREIDDVLSAPWPELLAGSGAVVHLAALAHRAPPSTAQAQAQVYATNRDAVARLTHAAIAARLERLVLVSSVGVLGASSGGGAFDERSRPAPHDLYTRSKLAGEEAAARASAGSALQLCIVRPPLVFGPDAPGNFARLTRYVERGLPLPLAGIDNRRSLISVWNLCDLLLTCLTHAQATSTPVLAADDEALSTPQLIRRCAQMLGRPARLFYVAPRLLQLTCRALGRQADYQRLCDSLVVDTSESCRRLGWRPPLTLSAGLMRSLQPSATH